MIIKALTLAALLFSATAFANDSTAPSEPVKVEYLKCMSLMEKSASSAMMAFSSGAQIAALKDKLKANECLVELTPRIQDADRLGKFQNVEAVWGVAVSTPSALATAEYIKTAQGFLQQFD